MFFCANVLEISRTCWLVLAVVAKEDIEDPRRWT
jgi:hypothetical protein